MSTQELKNEHVTVELKREPDCVVHMTLVVSPAEAAIAYKKGIKNISKEVSFPGFRKGRAPDQMVQTKYAGQIQREFRELLLNDAIREAVNLAKIYPWKREGGMKAEVIEASLEKGGRFKIEFECFPEIPAVDPKELVISPVHPEAISEEHIEKHIDSLRYHHAEWDEVEGRPTADGDFVEVKLEALDAGVAPRHTSFHLKKEAIEGWLYDLLLDKKVGEATEIIPPKSKEVEEHAALQHQEERTLRFTIEKIRIAKLDEVAEPFVKKFGVETVDEFQKKVREYLQREEEQRVRHLKHQLVQKKMIERYPFDIPRSLKEDEREQYLNDLIQDCKDNQMSDAEIEKIHDKIQAAAEERALIAVRTHYLLSRLADEKHLGITEDEVMQEIVRQSYRDGQFDMELLKNPDKYKPLIANRLRLNKAMDYLVEHASVTN